MDSRAGRVLKEGERSIFDEDEWDWIVEHASGDFDHLLISTTVPFLLSPGFHHLEAWSERVCDGAWGGLAARGAEKIRRAVDFDHWASFNKSFQLLRGLLEEVGAGKRGKAPASIVVLSGDVHHAYLAEIAFRPGGGDAERRLPGRLLALPQPARRPRAAGDQSRLHPPVHRRDESPRRAAGAADPGLRWRLAEGPSSTTRSRPCAWTGARR